MQQVGQERRAPSSAKGTGRVQAYPGKGNPNSRPTPGAVAPCCAAVAKADTARSAGAASVAGHSCLQVPRKHVMER
jgi:hypothetical protein